MCLARYAVFSGFERPYIGVDEQERCPVKFSCRSETLGNFSIEMRKPNAITSGVSINYFAIELKMGLF